MSRYLPSFAVLLIVGLVNSVLSQDGGSDGGPGSPGNTDRFTRLIEAQSVTPFVGVTAGDGPIEGLYTIDPEAGASNADLVQAAQVFLTSLTAEQRTRTMFSVDAPEWREWSNMSAYHRRGIGFDEMTEVQRERAFQLMRTALSAKGFKLSRDIMRLNQTLGELTQHLDRYSEWFYWLTVMGEPSETEPWGWQLDGHHLVINYFVLGNQVVMSPVFTGGEPVIAESGLFEGTRVLDTNREKAYAVYASLTEEQKNIAVLGEGEISLGDGPAVGRNSTELMEDNAVVPYQGIVVSDLSVEQQRLVVDLIEEFISLNREPHAAVRMEEILAHIDETYFAWHPWEETRGLEDVFFFRIQSPVIIIEFDHVGAIALPNARSDVPLREHIHSVVRTPNGNDYGRSLLLQHYAQHPH
jgi:hypothetical protein